MQQSKAAQLHWTGSTGSAIVHLHLSSLLTRCCFVAAAAINIFQAVLQRLDLQQKRCRPRIAS